METRSINHQDAGVAIFNTDGVCVAQAFESRTGWFVSVPYREGRGNGIPNFEVSNMTVVSLELLLTTIAKGLGET